MLRCAQHGKPTSQFREAVLGAGLILATTIPLFCLGLGDRFIWIPQEARYALVAREMGQGGDWILPHLGGMVYPDKPPLLFWSIALLSALGSGVSEWTARLPSALAAIAVCLITWRMGARLLSPRAGLLGALVLATSGGFFWSGRQALPDMLLTLWVTGGCWALWEWLVMNRRSAAIATGLCIGLAMLTKGPVGVVLPTLTALAYLAVRREWRIVCLRDVMLCGGVFLTVTLLWYLPAIGRGGLTYVHATLIHHNVERYVKAWEHVAPWYFYLGAFPAEFLPWTLFLPQALLVLARKEGQEDLRGWWFAGCWLVTTLVFFSTSTGKRDVYIIPAFPAAALLVGGGWSRGWDQVPSRMRKWWMIIPTLLLAFGVWGLAMGIWEAIEVLPRKSTLLLPATLEARRWTGVLLVLGGMLLAGVAMARSPRYLYGCIVGCTWVTMLASAVLIYTPQFNQRNPIKTFAQDIRTSIDPGKPLHVCGPMNDLALSFNRGRFLPSLATEQEVARYLASGDLVYCVMDAPAYTRLGELTGQHFPVLIRRDIDRTPWLLIANQPLTHPSHAAPTFP